jgi:3-phenylpropionate/cinnamic acid dioxygenase small subunit
MGLVDGMAQIDDRITQENTRSRSERIPARDPRYGDIVDFLIDEAALLDDDRHHEWLAHLTDDVSYKMPVRKTVHRAQGRGFDERTGHFDDNRMSLSIRVSRSVDIPSAYDRDPPPRIRRLITNIVAHETSIESEFHVKSYITLLRSRFDEPDYDMLSGQREDILRQTSDGLKLAARVVYLDQAALGAPYLNVFM